MQRGSKPRAAGSSADGPSCPAPEPAASIAEAIGNPLRNKVLNAVLEIGLVAKKEAGVLPGITVRRLSEQIGEPRRKVRYHLDALLGQGVIRVVEVSRRGGAFERHFVPVRRSLLSRSDVEKLTQVQQQRALMGCLRLIIASVASALDAGVAVKRPEWAAIRIPVRVDHQGWMELAKIHEDLIAEVDSVVARARARLEESDEAPVHAVSANLLFATPPPESQAGEVAEHGVEIDKDSHRS